MSAELALLAPKLGPWKFRLSTFLIFIALVALAIHLIVQSRQLRDAKIELRKLRDETGQLTVEDRTKVHIRQIDSPEPGTWRWRVFLPAGIASRYGWSLAYGDIPAKGFPKPTTNAFWNGPFYETENEVLVTASLQKAGDGDWLMSVSSRIGNSKEQMGGASIVIPDEFLKAARTGCEVADFLGSKETDLLKPGQPIVLLKWRACGTMPDGSEGVTDSPTPGYMIWMRPF
jgi:hypothetical protein